MKICLVNPPVRDFYYTSVRRQPLGLLYIAAALRADGHDVTLVNGHSRKHSHLALPEHFHYLKEYIDHPDPELRFPFSGYKHYGMSFEEMRKRIKEIQPGMVMVSSMFTPYHQEAERSMTIAREVIPEAFIAAGGHHPTLHPDYLVTEGLADFVITGEGEIPAVLLARAVESGQSFNEVPGLVRIEGGEVLRNRPFHPDPDELPLPARDLLLNRDFSFYRSRGVSIVAGRGCPNRCAFCTAREVFGPGRRCRRTESIIGEITGCVERHGVNIINFEDDNLFADRIKGIELLQALDDLQEQKKIRLDLTAMNGISLEHVDDEILGLMKQAGFREINVSLVSVSSRVQEKSGRPFDSKKFRHIVLAADKLDLHVRAYFILGLPDQTNEEIEETINFLEEMGIEYFPSVYYDVTASRDEWPMQRSSAFFNETGYITRQNLVRWFNRCMAGQRKNRR